MNGAEGTTRKGEGGEVRIVLGVCVVCSFRLSYVSFGWEGGEGEGISDYVVGVCVYFSRTSAITITMICRGDARQGGCCICSPSPPPSRFHRIHICQKNSVKPFLCVYGWMDVCMYVCIYVICQACEEWMGGIFHIYHHRQEKYIHSKRNISYRSPARSLSPLQNNKKKKIKKNTTHSFPGSPTTSTGTVMVMKYVSVKTKANGGGEMNSYKKNHPLALSLSLDIVASSCFPFPLSREFGFGFAFWFAAAEEDPSSSYRWCFSM